MRLKRWEATPECYLDMFEVRVKNADELATLIKQKTDSVNHYLSLLQYNLNLYNNYEYPYTGFINLNFRFSDERLKKMKLEWDEIVTRFSGPATQTADGEGAYQHSIAPPPESRKMRKLNAVD
eukprot:GHVN01003731.1.p1 GENE.GHVN01003731.1~~GHVN01003731.1.p1  ORF type:complete len:123 (-),score=18.19 GHVN01003731.1:336-704(-)